MGVAKTALEAIDGAEAILVAVPANGHKMVVDAIAPHVTEGQTVFFTSQLSLSAAYLDQLARRHGRSVKLAAWGATLISGRRHDDKSVFIRAIRTPVLVADYDARYEGNGYRLATELFGPLFEQGKSYIEVALSNVGAVIHLPLALCNLTRMERSEEWCTFSCTTKAVGRLTELFDAERLAIAKAVGANPISIQQHLGNTFGLPMDSVARMMEPVAAKAAANKPNGPKGLGNRYIDEDVVYAGVPTERIGEVLGIPTPMHSLVVDMIEKLVGRPMREDNEILRVVDLDHIIRANQKS